MTGNTEKSRGARDVLEDLFLLERLTLHYQHDLANPHFFKALNVKFQGGYKKVFEFLHNHLVKKYVFKPSGRTTWIVVGRERDYLILPEAPYCHCTNFYMHVINGQAKMCMHLAAQRIAFTLNKFVTIEESDNLRESLMTEWNAQWTKEVPI